MGCSSSVQVNLNDLILQLKNRRFIEFKNQKFTKKEITDIIQGIMDNYIIERLSLYNIKLSTEEGSNYIQDLSDAIINKISFKELELVCLSDLGLGQKKGKNIGEIFKTCWHLNKAIIRDCELDDNDIEHIADAIVYLNTTIGSNINYLDLSGNFFEKKIKLLFYSLQDNKSITKLILQKMNINKINIEILLQSILNNHYIEHLDLSNNPIKNGTNFFR